MRYVAGPRGIKLDIGGELKKFKPGESIPEGIKLRNVTAMLKSKKLALAGKTVLVAGRKGLSLQGEDGEVKKYEQGDKLPEDLKLKRQKSLEDAGRIEKVSEQELDKPEPEASEEVPELETKEEKTEAPEETTSELDKPEPKSEPKKKKKKGWR